MPYNNCQRIKEDGHRCNKQFRVPSHLWQMKFCPECETNPTKQGNRRIAESNEIKMREYVIKLMDLIPDVESLVPYSENKHLTGIEERVESVKGQLDSFTLVIGTLKGSIGTNKTHMHKTINALSNTMKEELNVIKKDFSQATEPEVIKINNYMVILSNRIHKLEKKVFNLIEELAKVNDLL